jgi:thioredoxin reductase
VENYPGVVGYDATGRGIISLMRAQAASFGVRHVAEAVLTVETVTNGGKKTTPKKGGNGEQENNNNLFKVTLNDTAQTVVFAKAVIAATGASSRWLGVQGEAELRGGGGVSACATCDG